MKRKTLSKAVCVACGEEFDTRGVPSRKYCCHEHYIADRFKQKVRPIPKEEILFNIGENVPEPIFDETSQSINTELNEAIPVLPVRIANSNEKLRPQRVYLLAGQSKFQGKFEHFSGLIPLAAQAQLMDGDVFVYCNAQRT